MISVSIYKTKDTIKGFMIEGHSDYGESGTDIVCASVSVLSYTAINSLHEVAGLMPEEINLEINEDTGFVSVRTQKCDMKTDIIYKNFIVGIKLLLEDYSEYITLKFKEV